MDIVYIKLTNGDELFGRLMGEEGDRLLLADVMVMETIQVDSEMKYLFMTRMDQYTDIHSMALDKSHVVFIHEASAVVKNHYEISVRYAEQISDGRFHEGISDASRYLDSVLKVNKEKQSKQEDSFENVKDRVLGTFRSSSNTKH